MKLSRSRFRFLSLLTACAFLLTAVFCAVSALRSAGVTLPFPGATPVPSALSFDVTVPPAEAETVSPSPEPAGSPEVTTEPDQEYNLYGL